MRNFLKQTFQPKVDKNQIKKQEIQNKPKDIKLKPKISQEIMNANLSLLGFHPSTQNLKKDDINNKTKETKEKESEKLNLKNIKETITKKKNDKDDKNIKTNNNNKEYKQPYKPLAHYIIDKNLRFDENKSKNKNKNNINLSKNKTEENPEFNSDEEDELIKSKRRKINLALNESKKRDKMFQEKMAFKKSLNALINDEQPPKEEKSDIKLDNPNKKKIKKSVSGNFVRLNLKKKYQEKKRFRPVKLRKIALNHSKELYKYQKKTIKNSMSNYMGKGNQGLEDMDTLKQEQNDAEKNDNSNLLNTLSDKLPVFSQSFIEETQKTPMKLDENNNNNDNNIKVEKNIIRY